MFYSKLALTLACGASFCFFFSACSYFFGSKAQPATSIKIEKDSGVCLKTLGTNLSSWAETGRPDIGVSVDCAVKAVDDFTASVSGQNQGSYSPDELSQFFGTYFAKGGEFLGTDVKTWVAQLLKLKQIVFGGAGDRVTRDEIAQARKLLLDLRPALERISPHVGVALFKSKKAQSGETIEVDGSISDITTILAATFERANKDRPTFDLESLVKMIRQLGFRSGQLETWLPFAKAMKGITIGGDSNMVIAQDWAIGVKSLGQAWALAVHLDYDIVENDDPLGRGIAELDAFSDDALRFLKQSIELQGRPNSLVGAGPSISRAKLDSLVDAVFDLESKGQIQILSGRFVNLNASIVKNLLAPVLGKVLYGNSKPMIAEHQKSFGLEQFATLKDAVQDWLAAQRVIALTAPGEEVIPLADLVQAFDDTQARIKSLKDSAQQTAETRARMQMMNLLSTGRPMVREHDATYGDRLVVSKAPVTSLSRDDLNLQNFVRASFSLVMRGYSHDANAPGLLTDVETQEVYLDVRELGKAVGFMDTRNNGSGTRTFMEASIFTSVGNGDNHIDFHEVFDWFHFVLTGGILADRIHKQISALNLVQAGQKVQCVLPTVDVLGNHRLQVVCFRYAFEHMFAEMFKNLPGFVKWVSDPKFPTRQHDVRVAAEFAGRLRGISERPLDSTELRSMVPIIHYAESIFVRFDTDGSDVLEEDELWKAFPILAPFIQKMGGGFADDEEMQKAIFSYLIVYGTPPKSDFGGAIGLIWHRYIGEHLSHLSADRVRVLNLIGAFSQVSRDNHEKAVEDYFKSAGTHLRGIILTHDPKDVAAWSDIFLCQPEAQPLMSQLFQTQVDTIAPSGDPGRPAEISERVKALIAADPQLQYLCLPF